MNFPDWFLILLLILAITDLVIQRRRAYIYKDIMKKSFGLTVRFKKVFFGKGNISIGAVKSPTRKSNGKS